VDSTPQRTGKQVGLAALNLLFVLLILFGAQRLMRGHVNQTAGLAILSLLVFGAYLVGYRIIEGLRPPELVGLLSLKEFFAGLALGVTLFSAVIAVLWLLRVYHLQARGTTAGLGAGALSALLAATVEETLIRGFLFRIVQMVGGTWIALIISSAFFGAAHAFNPGATVTSSLAITLEAGVLLAAAYVLAGRLSFPMGLHAGWNFSEGSLYGLSVSGFTAKNALTQGSLTGPVILTGGAFGPEASIVAVILCVGVAILLLSRAAKLGRMQPPLWSARTPAISQSTAAVTGPESNPNIDR
jgi:membrane protease YdiL (CAAX protease family)